MSPVITQRLLICSFSRSSNIHGEHYRSEILSPRLSTGLTRCKPCRHAPGSLERVGEGENPPSSFHPRGSSAGWAVRTHQRCQQMCPLGRQVSSSLAENLVADSGLGPRTVNRFCLIGIFFPSWAEMDTGKGLGQTRDSGRTCGHRLFADFRPGGPGASEPLNLRGQGEGVLVRILQRKKTRTDRYTSS